MKSDILRCAEEIASMIKVGKLEEAKRCFDQKVKTLKLFEAVVLRDEIQKLVK